MKKNYLLPHNFKMIGLIMLVPFLAACIWLLLGRCEGDWFIVDVPALFTLDLASTSEWFGMTATDPVNEICMLGLLVAILFVYDLAFMYFAFASVFVCFIMYICKFNYEMIKIRRMQNEE